MGQTRLRTITLVITIITTIANTLSSLLFHKLPDDPYHLASSFSCYLYFANGISVVGFTGALRQHATCITIFANYLLLDTLLFSIPRFLALGILSELTTSICAFDFHPTRSSSTTSVNTDYLTLPADRDTAISILGLEAQWSSLTDSWTPEECVQLVWLAQLTLIAGAVAATFLQIVGALYVREYAKMLWRRRVAIGQGTWTADPNVEEAKAVETGR